MSSLLFAYNHVYLLVLPIFITILCWKLHSPSLDFQALLTLWKAQCWNVWWKLQICWHCHYVLDRDFEHLRYVLTWWAVLNRKMWSLNNLKKLSFKKNQSQCYVLCTIKIFNLLNATYLHNLFNSLLLKLNLSPYQSKFAKVAKIKVVDR
jgi:hypothetical protein